MKAIATTIITCALFTLAAQSPAEDDSRSERFDRFGTAYQFIFNSVLEGLYQDGATQEEVQRVLMKRSDEHGYEHFIYSCPICTSVKLAFELYAKRPKFSMYKPGGQPHQVKHATFGIGFSEKVKMGLNSDDVKVRLETLHLLVSKWIDDRMTRMNLSKVQREALFKEIEDGREQGMKALTNFKKDPAKMKIYAPGYGTFKECAMCNAASHMDFDRILEKKTGEAASDYAITIEPVSIPRDEVIQQTLLNLREYRAAYTLKPVPTNTVLFLECYVDGKQVARYKSTYAKTRSQEKEKWGTGFLSVAWLADKKEFVLLNDNGYRGGWVHRLQLPEEVFDEPSHVFWFQKPTPELRQRRPELDGDERKETVYPILGICGKKDRQFGLFGSSVEDFIKACSRHGVHQFIIVYMYMGRSGEYPGIPFDN